MTNNGNPLQPARQRIALFLVTMTVMACGGGDRAADTTATLGDSALPVATGGEAEQLYARCVACHQVNGEGLAGAFPPLAGSEYVTSSNPAVPILVVLHGMQGPVTVKGTEFNSLMPAFGTGVEMTDGEVATVVTYIRSSWGNSASAVTADDVAKARSARTASGPTTAAELRGMMQ